MPTTPRPNLFPCLATATGSLATTAWLARTTSEHGRRAPRHAASTPPSKSSTRSSRTSPSRNPPKRCVRTFGAASAAWNTRSGISRTTRTAMPWCGITRIGCWRMREGPRNWRPRAPGCRCTLSNISSSRRRSTEVKSSNGWPRRRRSTPLGLTRTSRRRSLRRRKHTMSSAAL